MSVIRLIGIESVKYTNKDHKDIDFVNLHIALYGEKNMVGLKTMTMRIDTALASGLLVNKDYDADFTIGFGGRAELCGLKMLEVDNMKKSDVKIL